MNAEAIEPPTDEDSEFDATPAPERWFSDAIRFILEAPDVVEVMLLTPWYPDEGDDEDDDDDDNDEDVKIREGSGFLYGHTIRGTARVPTALRRRALGQALLTANREEWSGALCFDPHYAVRVSRDGRSADFLICFWCHNVRVILPDGSAEMYPIGWSAARLLRRELRRGGVGWLWFWRRWLPLFLR